MTDPIYEIPVTPPEPSAGGWHPGRPGRRAAVERGFDGLPGSNEPSPLAGLARPPAATMPLTPAAPPRAIPFERLLSGDEPPAMQPAVQAEPFAPPTEPMPLATTPQPIPSVVTPQPLPTVVTPQPMSTPPSATPPAPTVLTPVAHSPLSPLGAPPTPFTPTAPAPAHASEAPSLVAPRESVIEAPIVPIELEEHARDHADPELIEALIQVVRQGASDLHVTVGAPPMVRVNGDLRPATDVPPWNGERVDAALASLLTAEQAERFETALELDFAYGLSEQSRFRVNYYQQRGSLGAAFRLIPTEIKQLSELGVPESVSRFAALPRGLVLITGPTGSGKSTTLAALIDLVNRTRADHIVTVEDPIEFVHRHKKSIVNQREVGEDTHSFANALKHVLRQDPDVILIGELRDLETISVALTAAETGHLVFATLHTQDAPQSIDRMIDVFPPHQQDQVRTQLAGTLQGVVSQTLVPKASGSGRAVAAEILVMTPAVGNLIREGKTYQIASAMQAGRELGMQTMDQHLAELVNEGRITHKAAVGKAHDPDGFGRLIQRVESPSEASSQAIAQSGPDFGDAFSGTTD